jgi:outer membrane protein TolC
MAELEKLAQLKHPALRAAEEKALAARRSVTSTLGGLLPHVDLELSAAKSVGRTRSPNNPTSLYLNDNSDTSNTALSGRVVVSVPLLANGSGGNLYSASRRANQEALVAELTHKKMISDIMAECVRIWNTFKASETQLRQSKLAVDSAEMAADGVRQAATYGVKSQTDVLYFEGQLLEIRSKAVEIQKNYVLMAYTMLSLIGRLTVEGLHLNVTPYRAEENEHFVRWAPPFVVE